MQKDQVVFRSAIGGYHREDVNQYILRLHQSFEERERQWQNETDSVQTTIRKLEDQQSESEKLIANLHECIDRLKEENNALSLRSVQAESNCEQMKKRLAELEETIRQANAGIATDSASADDSGTASEKSRKYDEISAQIGDILIHANTSAEQILTAASAKAAQIVADTEEEENYIRTRLSDTADEMLTHISQALHTSTEDCLSELLTALREMRDRTDLLLRDFDARNRELGERVDYYQTSVSESIQKAIREMDQKYGIRSAETDSVPDRKPENP